MKIESGRGVASSSGAKGAGAAAAPGFVVATEPSQRAAPAASAGMAGAVASLDAILALQGGEGPAHRRSRQARRGREALDTLEKLERALAFGLAPAGIRGELESARTGAELTGEPGLDGVLLEIDVRLAVEAAKLDRNLGGI